MNLREEMKQAIEKGMIFIPPFKLAEMNKLASKIVKLLTDNITAVSLSYSDMKTVMAMVENTLDFGIQEGGNDNSENVSERTDK